MTESSLSISSLSPIDWVLVVLLAASTIRAFLRGFVLEVFSLVGLTAGLLLASWNYTALAAQLVLWLKPLTTISLGTAGIVAFILIAGLVMAACGLAGKLLRSSVSAVGLGLIDRSLGAIFGFARGCLAGIAGIALLTALAPAAGILQNSRLLPYFLVAARGVSFVVPRTLQQQLADGADRIKHNGKLWIKPLQ